MDKRKNNGNKGHSTKAKGVDKRKNEYRELLDLAATPDEVVEVIKTLKVKAIEKQDVNAIKLFLEYYLGKPKETIETTHNVNTFDIKEVLGFGK
jgi:uncharacterized protein (DUF1697 family)